MASASPGVDDGSAAAPPATKRSTGPRPRLVAEESGLEFLLPAEGSALLEAPDSLMKDWDVIGRVMTVYQDRDQRPPEPALGPGRSAILSNV